jgi:hypothetical protein
MMSLTLTVAVLLSQNAATVPLSNEERAILAAERAADAAERAAVATQRMADALAGPVPAPTAAAATPSADLWRGNVGFGLSYLTGNSQQLTITAQGSADKSWGKWGLGIKANAAYGLSNPSANVAGTEPSVTARRASGTLRGDRSFGDGFASLFILGGAEFDHLKNIEFRTYGEGGTGLTFFNVKQGDLEKVYLRFDLALRAGYESRYQYFPMRSSVVDPQIAILAPRAAIAFRWGFSKDVHVSEDLEFVPFLLAPTSGRLLINNTTKLLARLTETLSLSTSLLINFDSKPPASIPARLPTDVALTVGIEAAF